MEQSTATTHRTEQAVIVTVTGEVDLLTSRHFDTLLEEAIRHAGGLPVVIDMTDVTFLDSTAIAALFAAVYSARRNQVPLSLIANSRDLLWRINIAGLAEVLQVYRTVDAALSDA